MFKWNQLPKTNTLLYTKSNNLFDIQVGIAKKMAEMDFDDNPFVVKEMEAKLQTLQTFIDKMEDLTSELVIHLSSNKKDNDDINNLFNDMDDLIEVMQNYGAYNAANLDGGTSSVMVVDGKIINDPVDSSGAHKTRYISTGFILTKGDEE